MSLSAVRLRAVHAVRAYLHRDWDETITGFNEIPAVALRILRMIYMLLSFAFTSSAFGLFFRDNEMIGGSFAAIGSFASLLSLYLVAPHLKEIRVFFFITGSFFGAAFLGPWFASIVGLDSKCILTVLVGISLGFQCFWAASNWAIHFDLYYVSGLFLSFIVVMLWVFIALVEFGGDSAIWASQIFAAIMTLMLYVMAYTQVLVQKIMRRERDYVRLAIAFFTDLPPVIIYFAQRIASIICGY